MPRIADNFIAYNQQDTHPVKDCEDGMCCEICMNRCYMPPHESHVFNNNTENCECGKYKNIDEVPITKYHL